MEALETNLVAQAADLCPHTKYFGLLDRKERWGLSITGHLFLLMLFAITAAVIILIVHPFLSVTNALSAKVLVVEGWVPPYVVKEAAREIHHHSYGTVLTTGGPIPGTGPYRTDAQTSAYLCFNRLLAEGIATNVLHEVPSQIEDRDRTYGAALALKAWFDSEGAYPDEINVLTESVHARRTRLLFEKALGDRIKVGVIAIPPIDYPAGHWWRYSAGVKSVVSEFAAYIYARVFFWPETKRLVEG
jgi:hypothetical protein